MLTYPNSIVQVSWFFCQRTCVCVCVCVCVSFHRKGFSGLKQNNKCNARDQASDVVLRKLFYIKYLRRHVIDNHSSYLKASNCARMSIKPGRATRSKRQLLKLPKNQRKKRELQLHSSSLAILPQHKGGQLLSGLPTYRWTVTAPTGFL